MKFLSLAALASTFTAVFALAQPNALAQAETVDQKMWTIDKIIYHGKANNNGVTVDKGPNKVSFILSGATTKPLQCTVYDLVTSPTWFKGRLGCQDEDEGVFVMISGDDFPSKTPFWLRLRIDLFKQLE